MIHFGVMVIYYIVGIIGLLIALVVGLCLFVYLLCETSNGIHKVAVEIRDGMRDTPGLKWLADRDSTISVIVIAQLTGFAYVIYIVLHRLF